MSHKPLSVSQAAILLQEGKVVAYPTEAVFGLGCCPQNNDAIANLLALKQRASNKGFILIASSVEQLLPYIETSSLPRERWDMVQQSWPGPFTWVFPATDKVSPSIKGGFITVAVRVTAHPVAKALCQAFGGALISTSANLSLQAPLKEGEAVAEQFRGAIAGVVAGSVGDALNPTTVQDALTGKIYR
jgi:L-threonylcarbamoyladenylate synthase